MPLRRPSEARKVQARNPARTLSASESASPAPASSPPDAAATSASPNAPPIHWSAFSRPDVTPACSSGVPPSAAADAETNEQGMATPRTSNPGTSVVVIGPSAGSPDRRQRPIAMSVDPATSMGRGPRRVTSLPTRLAQPIAGARRRSSAAPVCSDDNPRAPCRYTASRRSIPSITAPCRTPTVPARTRPRSRSTHRGSRGSSARRSHETNHASAIDPTARATRLVRDPQPATGPFDRTKTSAPIPVVTSSAPPTSTRPVRDAVALGITVRIAASATRPNGTLIRKTDRQPARSVKTPPTTSPATAPREPIDPQVAMARFRSRPAGNAAMRIANAAGETTAAPTPWATRAATSTAPDGASPHASDAAVNTARPTVNVRRRPTTSLSRPPTSSAPPNVTAYAVTTQWRLVGDRRRSCWRVGRATFTIVTSRTTRNCAVPTSASNEREARARRSLPRLESVACRRTAISVPVVARSSPEGRCTAAGLEIHGLPPPIACGSPPKQTARRLRLDKRPVNRREAPGGAG